MDQLAFNLKPKKQSVICEYCGSKNVEYKFTFNKGLAVFLIKLVQAGGVAKTDNLGLTYSQRTNSQKLRYWGLAVPHLNEEGSRKRGWWKVTEEGMAFYNGEKSIQSEAVTVKGKVVRLQGKQIRIEMATEGWKHRDHYVDQARKQINNDEV